MVRLVKFWRHQRQLLGWYADIEKRHRKALAASPNATEQEKHDLGWDFHMEETMVEDELASLNSRFLTAEAQRLMIPVPEFKAEGGAWTERTAAPGQYRLTTQAIHQLRAEIRAERRGRDDLSLMWVAALTGLVGALTGLFAVVL